MKRPLSDRIYYLQRLISQAIADVDHLLATYPEEEVKDFVYLLLDIKEDYQEQMSLLAKRLKAQNGYDFEI